MEEQESDKPKVKDEEFADDAFLMVSQLHWEDDVVWNGDDIKHKVQSYINKVVSVTCLLKMRSESISYFFYR